MTLSYRTIVDFIYQNKFIYLCVGLIMIIISVALISASQTSFNGVIKFKITSNYHENIDEETINFFKLNNIDNDFEYNHVNIYDVLSNSEVFESLESYKDINFNSLPSVETNRNGSEELEYITVSLKLENYKTEQIALNELNQLYKNVNNQIINKTKQNLSKYIGNILQNTEILIQELNLEISDYIMRKKIVVHNLITMLENSAALVKTYDKEINREEKKRFKPFSPIITPSMIIEPKFKVDALSYYEEGLDVILEKLKIAETLKNEGNKNYDLEYIDLIKLHEKAKLDFNVLNIFLNDLKKIETVNVKPFDTFNVDMYVTKHRNVWFGKLNISLLISISILITLFVSPLLGILYKGVEINIED